MLGIRPDRLWAAGGAVAAILLLVIGWFFLIAPQHEQTAALDSQEQAARTRLASLQQRLVELRNQTGNLDQYRAQLARDRQALPVTPGLADFLRELQAAGIAAGAVVSGLIVGTATPVAVPGGAQVTALPVTLTVAGAADKLSGFIDQLRKVQPRAVLITSVNAVPEGQSGSFSGTVTLTLMLQVFVAAG